MITRLVSLAFAIIALILLLRKQFHALDIFSDLTKIYGLLNVSFLPFFKGLQKFEFVSISREKAGFLILIKHFYVFKTIRFGPFYEETS